MSILLHKGYFTFEINYYAKYHFDTFIRNKKIQRILLLNRIALAFFITYLYLYLFSLYVFERILQ